MVTEPIFSTVGVSQKFYMIQKGPTFHVPGQLVRHRGVVGLAGLDAHDRRDERPHGQSRVHLGRGLFNEPAGDSLNNLPQSMIDSWRRLVVVCFHACRVYRKTGKETFLQETGCGIVSASPHLRVRLFTPLLWDGSDSKP